MDEEALNLSVRKLLKQFGITAQREVELGVREKVDAGQIEGDRLPARATLTVDGLDEEIVVEGEIRLA